LICSAKPAEISQKSRGCWGSAGGDLRSEKTDLRICFKLRRFLSARLKIDAVYLFSAGCFQPGALYDLFSVKPLFKRFKRFEKSLYDLKRPIFESESVL